MGGSLHGFEVAIVNTFMVPSEFEQDPFHDVFDPSCDSSNIDGWDALLRIRKKSFSNYYFSVECCCVYKLLL